MSVDLNFVLVLFLENCKVLHLCRLYVNVPVKVAFSHFDEIELSERLKKKVFIYKNPFQIPLHF